MITFLVVIFGSGIGFSCKTLASAMLGFMAIMPKVTSYCSLPRRLCSQLAIGSEKERLYFPGLGGFARVGQLMYLPQDEVQHMRARRIEPGDKVELFDGVGLVALTSFVGYEGKKAQMKLEELLPVRKSIVSITAAVAIPKPGRADWMVEKLTELGVERIVPLLAERSSTEIKDNRMERFARLAISASKQCRRDLLPMLAKPTTVIELAGIVEREKETISLLASFHGNPLKDVQIRQDRPYIIIVGPEGGFTNEEESLLLEYVPSTGSTSSTRCSFFPAQENDLHPYLTSHFCFVPRFLHSQEGRTAVNTRPDASTSRDGICRASIHPCH